MKSKTLCVLLGGAIAAVSLTGCRTAPDIGWEGRRVAFLGDSITDPRQKHEIYWQYLAEWLDLDALSYGVGGATWRHLPGQIERMEREMGDDVDAIFVFMGTNDYQKDLPLGRWYDETPGDVVWHGKTMRLSRRSFNRDAETVRGAVNIAMDRLRTRYPKAQIVVLTPIHRAFFQCSATNVQPAEDWPNKGGTYLDTYIDCIKEIGNVWSVPVIDLNADAGLMPLNDASVPYFRDAEKDRLHPNGAGHERIAKVIYARLKALPGAF